MFNNECFSLSNWRDLQTESIASSQISELQVVDVDGYRYYMLRNVSFFGHIT